VSRNVRLAAALAGLAALHLSPRVQAEPSIALRTGLACSTCHVNRTGGGMRTPFGSLWSQTALPMRVVRWRDDSSLLPADPDARFAFGADARFQMLGVNDPDAGDSASFETPEANLYAEARVIPGMLSFYADEEIGPGGASARELFAMLRQRSTSKLNGYVKVGKFLPVYGFRLPDDASYIRQFSGFTYSAPDIGIEAGIEPGKWSLHLDAVNGASGGGEDNQSKQFSLLVAKRFGGTGTGPSWRLGASGSNNILPGTRVTQAGLFAGGSLGRLTVFGEGDWRQTRTAGVETERLTGYFEADLLATRGLLVKYAHDWSDPDRDQATDARARDSLGVEFIPVPYVQIRLFARRSDGPPQVAGSRNRQLDLELHFFF
jgi:hypothetical protein